MKEPLPSIAPCIARIRDIVASETQAKRDVVMVDHSFGGVVVGCSAVNGFRATDPSKLAGSGKVVGIIQMCALTVPTGVSSLEILRNGGRFRYPADGPLWSRRLGCYAARCR